MERRVDVRTGEAVAFAYELAGVGSRFLAVAVDMLAQAAVLAVLFGLALWLAPAVLRVAPSKFVAALQIALAAIAVFAVTIGWFIVFEGAWGGRTPGKRLLGLRVVRDGGFPLDWGACIIRNLVRLLELPAGFYGIAALSAILSGENKRLGDLAAGTIVVRERSGAPAGLGAYLDAPARVDTGLRDADRLLIGRYFERRDQLAGPARALLAQRLALRIRPTLRAEYNNLDDQELLAFLAGRRLQD